MKAVIIGFGVMGHYHWRVLHELGVDDVVTVDIDLDTGANYRSLPPDLEADVACIAVPPEDLVDVSEQVITVGVPRILVEKPMALTRGEARELIEVVEEQGVEAAVGYTERTNPAVEALNDNLGRIGPIHHVTAKRLGPPPRWNSDNPGVDLVTHDFDVLRLLGFEPQVEDASIDPMTARYRISMGDADAELTAKYQERKERVITLTGQDGILSLDYREQTLTQYSAAGAEQIAVQPAQPLRGQWERFLAGDPSATLEDGFVALDLALQGIAVE